MTEPLDWSKVGVPASRAILTYHIRGKGSGSGVSSLKDQRNKCPRRRLLDAEKRAALEEAGNHVIFLEGSAGIGVLFHAYMDIYHTKLRRRFNPADIRFEGEGGSGLSIDPVCLEEGQKLATWWMQRHAPGIFGPQAIAEFNPAVEIGGTTGIFDLWLPETVDCPAEWMLNYRPTIADWKTMTDDTRAVELASPQSHVYRMLAMKRFGLTEPPEFLFLFVIRGRSKKNPAPEFFAERAPPLNEAMALKWIENTRAANEQLAYCDVTKCVEHVYGKVRVCPHLGNGCDQL